MVSIDLETAKQHAEDCAVTCCRFEEGSTIEPSMLEDPTIFVDLEDSGLLTIPEDCLKIGQVLGAKLNKTVDALVALTPELVEGYQEQEAEQLTEAKAEVAAAAEPELTADQGFAGQAVRIHIGVSRKCWRQLSFNP